MKKLALSVICALCFFMAAPTGVFAADTDDAIKALQSYYDLGQKQDIEGMKAHMSREYLQKFEASLVENKDYVEIVKLLTTKTQNKIQGASMTGDRMIVSVLSNKPDFEKMIQKASKSINATNQAEFNRQLTEKITQMVQAGDYTMVESEVEVQLIKEDGAWKIIN